MTNNVLCYLVVTKTIDQEVASISKFEYYERNKAEKAAQETIENFHSKLEFEDFFDEDFGELQYCHILTVFEDGTTSTERIFN